MRTYKKGYFKIYLMHVIESYQGIELKYIAHIIFKSITVFHFWPVVFQIFVQFYCEIEALCMCCVSDEAIANSKSEGNYPNAVAITDEFKKSNHGSMTV